MKLKALFVVFFISYISFAQTNGMALTYFKSESKDYGIYYPKSFIATTQDNIATFTSPDAECINITVSSYFFEEKPSEEKIVTILSNVTGIAQKDWKNYQTRFDNFFEGTITNLDSHWGWWGINLKERLIVISINKNSEITTDDINLIRYIAEKIDIF